MQFLPNFTEFTSTFLCQFEKGQITSGAVTKGNNLLPFVKFACGNSELHATQIMFCYTAGTTNSNI
jgi:hypothetical protein